ncbi:MAG: glycosyltransferase family 1 protein [Chloroflexota bacterium]|nr:glycosyltransferase family 1 protein [Chloroflexota bacterium]
MRIGISAPIVEPHPTGVGIYSINLIDELAKLFDNLLVYTSYPPAFKIDPSKVRKVSSFTRPERGFAGFLNRMIWMQSSLPARTIIDHASVILSTGSEGTLLPLVPQVVTVHDIIPLLFPNLHPHSSELIFFRHFLPRILRRSSAIIVVSQSTKKDVIHFYNLPGEKIHVIYEGYDKQLFHPCQDSQVVNRIYGLEHYIHYAGNILPHKNVARLIQAFRLIASEIPHQLVLQGKQNLEYAAHLNILIDKLYLEGRVVFPGYVPLNHLPHLYAGASVFVSVSLSEGFGLTPLEAMACGTPVVASNISSLPEIVGDAGILVDPNNTEQIAEAILKVIKDSELRTNLSQKAIKRAALFSWDKTAKQTLEVLKAVAKPR